MVLTKRQSEVLNFIRSFITYNGYAPTMREIGGHLGISSLSTVHKHLTALEDRGAIRREAHKSRHIEVL